VNLHRQSVSLRKRRRIDRGDDDVSLACADSEATPTLTQRGPGGMLTPP